MDPYIINPSVSICVWLGGLRGSLDWQNGAFDIPDVVLRYRW